MQKRVKTNLDEMTRKYVYSCKQSGKAFDLFSAYCKTKERKSEQRLYQNIANEKARERTKSKANIPSEAISKQLTSSK